MTEYAQVNTEGRAFQKRQKLLLHEHHLVLLLHRKTFPMGEDINEEHIFPWQIIRNWMIS